MTLHEASDDIARALADLVRAAFDRRGELGTIDVTRPAAPARRDEPAREGKK